MTNIGYIPPLTFGILGAIITIYGHLFQTNPELYFVIGSTALMITAIAYRLFYFIALEFILAAGHAAALLGLGFYTQIALSVLLCFQLFMFYLMLGKQEHSFFLMVGILGILLLSLGFSYNNQWIFFTGSLGISSYAFYEAFKGQYPCYIWGLLNGIFAVSAFCKLIGGNT